MAEDFLKVDNKFPNSKLKTLFEQLHFVENRDKSGFFEYYTKRIIYDGSLTGTPKKIHRSLIAEHNRVNAEGIESVTKVRNAKTKKMNDEILFVISNPVIKSNDDLQSNLFFMQKASDAWGKRKTEIKEEITRLEGFLKSNKKREGQGDKLIRMVSKVIPISDKKNADILYQEDLKSQIKYLKTEESVIDTQQKALNDSIPNYYSAFIKQVKKEEKAAKDEFLKFTKEEKKLLNKKDKIEPENELLKFVTAKKDEAEKKLTEVKAKLEILNQNKDDPNIATKFQTLINFRDKDKQIEPSKMQNAIENSHALQKAFNTYTEKAKLGMVNKIEDISSQDSHDCLVAANIAKNFNRVELKNPFSGIFKSKEEKAAIQERKMNQEMGMAYDMLHPNNNNIYEEMKKHPSGKYSNLTMENTRSGEGAALLNEYKASMLREEMNKTPFIDIPKKTPSIELRTPEQKKTTELKAVPTQNPSQLPNTPEKGETKKTPSVELRTSKKAQDPSKLPNKPITFR